jgi:hypothetical protein
VLVDGLLLLLLVPVVVVVAFAAARSWVMLRNTLRWKLV